MLFEDDLGWKWQIVSYQEQSKRQIIRYFTHLKSESIHQILIWRLYLAWTSASFNLVYRLHSEQWHCEIGKFTSLYGKWQAQSVRLGFRLSINDSFGL